MKLGFLELPADERRLHIEQAAVRRSVSPVILEKDFWACWLLGILFESEFAASVRRQDGHCQPPQHGRCLGRVPLTVTSAPSAATHG